MQISGKYYPIQDRLILKIYAYDKKVYQFLLTRRISIKIAKHLTNEIINILSASNKKLSVKEMLDDSIFFNKKPVSDNKKKKGGQLSLLNSPLVVNASLGSMPKNKKKIFLSLSLKTGEQMSLELPLQAMQMIRGLINRISLQAKWNIPSDSKMIGYPKSPIDKSKLH